MKRDGCVTPVHKRYLVQLDEALSGSDSGPRMGWSVFRERAKAILEIPCDVPSEWVRDEASLRARAPEARKEADLVCDRWIDRHGYIHRSNPTGDRVGLAA
jgi:hypothetical protein